MPYEKSDSPWIWISWTDAGGRRIRRATNIPKIPKSKANWQKAKDLEDENKLQIKRLKKGDFSGITFDQLMVEYFKANTFSSSQKERDISSLKHLKPAFSGRILVEVQPHEIHSYVELRLVEGAAPGTINKETGLLSRAINWARKRFGWELPNPTTGTKQKEPEGRLIWLTHEDADALIKAAMGEPKAQHLVHFIRLGLNTGMRKMEMLNLTWDRVDLRQKLIYLQALDQKNRKFASVPLNQTAYETILSRARFRAEHCPDSPWVFCNEEGEQIKNVKRSFATACRRASLPADYTPHVLRHTFITWLVQQGVHIAKVQAAARHSDIRMTMRYAHLAPDDVRQSVAMLDSISG